MMLEYRTSGFRDGRSRNKHSRVFIRIDRRGISPILSTMLILLLMVTMITSILLWGTPTVDEFKTGNQYVSMRGLMETIDHRVDFLTSMGVNSSVNMDIIVPTGSLRVESDLEFWTVSYNLESPSIDTGIDFHYGDFEMDEEDRDVGFTIYSPLNQSADVVVEWMETGFVVPHYGVFLNGSRNFTTIEPLDGTFSITVRLNENKEVLSRCIVFPVNSIRGDFASPKGRFAFRAVNGGIVTEYPSPNNPKLVSAPEYLESFSRTESGSPDSNSLSMGDYLILNIMKFNSTGIDKAGQGSYDMSLSYSKMTPYEIGRVQNVRIHVNGKYQRCIYGGFAYKFSKGFTEIGSFSGFVEESETESLLFKVENTGNYEKENIVNLRINEHFISVDLEKS